MESTAVPVSAVTGIEGQSRVSVTFHGEAGHAGTEPMVQRKNALAAAAQFVLAAEAIGRQTADLVATVGSLHIEPGASNLTAGSATLSLDVRHPADVTRECAVSGIEARAMQISADRALGIHWNTLQRVRAVSCDPIQTSMLEQAIANRGIRVERLTTGAGHDGTPMAKVVPIAMLLVRCKGGVSHYPAESVIAPDVDAAIAGLDHFLELLAPRE